MKSEDNPKMSLDKELESNGESALSDERQIVEVND
jgi:hypothetical protein